MANSKYEYVKAFERPDSLLPNTWIVVRLDGRGFHKLSKKYDFEKPNDKRALDLMNAAAVTVMKELPDLVLGYGDSDEFSFVFDKDCQLFERRESKLVTTIVSTFTANYIHLWPSFFSQHPLSAPLPTFDGRAVLYPSAQNVRDYLSWRQADCHINNLYNTTFWALVQKGGITTQEAERELMGTYSSDKNEILFSRFGINYNNEPEMFRKGSVLYRDYSTDETTSSNPQSGALERSTPSSEGATPQAAAPQTIPQPDDQYESTTQPPRTSKTQQEKDRKRKTKARIAIEHIDIIGDEFWSRRPWILSRGPPAREWERRKE